MNASPGYQAVLILQETGQIFPLDQELTTIGRKTGNTIVLSDDLQVSRHHATIALEGGDYLLKDMGSANGTYLNGQRLTKSQVLKRGDIIQLGDVVFEVKLPLDDTEPRLSLPIAAPGSPAAEPKSTAVDTAVSVHETVEIPPENPYVGPRTFTQEESDRFFGREREARELLALIVANRLVLFYAQSGAGKSSLINARLISQLREAGNAVLPIGRVSGTLPEGITDVENIYIFNLLLSLDESDGDPHQFTHMTLADFLQNLTSLDGTHYYYDDTVEEDGDAPLEDEFEETTYVLIIDQFEEIISTHAGRWEDREAFFKQLAEAMTADPLLWVVLSLREDYVASLDPYIHLMPDFLRARFYMQRMSSEAALEAIEKPAEKFGRPFAPDVAESLVDNLRQIRVQGSSTPGQVKTQPGQFVEPVQLQVVCYQLWQNLKERPGENITDRDLRELADVDTALAQFYEEALAEVVRQTGVTEIDLRNWFETQLITEAKTRGTVYRGQTETGGIPNEAVDLLNRHFLLRSEVRTGGTWYELVHDRFVTPILQSNQAWRLEQPLIQLANAWQEADRSPAKLLEGQQLKEALGGKWQGLGPLVEAFMQASRTAQDAREKAAQAEKEQQRQRELEQKQALLDVQTEAAAKLRRRAWLLAAFVIVALLMALIAIYSAIQANQKAAEAKEALDEAQNQALAAAANADAARMLLDGQKATQTAIAEMGMVQDEEMAVAAEELDSKVISLEATITAEAAVAQTAEALATETAIAQATIDSLNQLTPASPTVPPTNTPESIYTPIPTDTPTLTPTATPSPTPNLAATATAEARVNELNLLRAEQQALQIESLPIEISESRCAAEHQGPFLDIWQQFRETLGCPLTAEPIGGSFAEQRFERGFMVWSQILGLFFVVLGDDQAGTWQVFTTPQVETFNPQEQGAPCVVEAPPNLVQPVRGFGAIWCAQEDLRRAIGFGLQPEYATQNTLIQEYEQGFVIKDSQERTFVLFESDNTYRRMR